MKHPEYHLQVQVCKYLQWAYPKVMFMSDTVASVQLTIGQQVRNKAIQKPGFKCPDLLILCPRGEYHGLLIELKVETPYKKDGQIKASQNNHLKNQLATLKELTELGYYARFGIGFEHTKEIIDTYMRLPSLS